MNYKDLSREELLELVNRLMEEKRKRRYGLVWEEQEEDVEKLIRANYPVLAEVNEREINKDKSNPMNLLIEGDNLHTLNTLLYTHRERIGLIYIDPPYNTGNRDFVYNDKIVDKEDTWRHSKWLSFMAKRLRIARELLSDDGVIFISIDDNEQAQLKLLCDEIFREENHVVTTVRKTKTMTGDDGTGMNIQHDFILGYAKNRPLMHLEGEEKDYSKFRNPDNDPNGPWVSGDPTAKSGSASLYFPIVNPYTGKIDYPSNGRYWAFSLETKEKYIQSGRITFKKKHPENQRGFIFKRYREQMTIDKNPIDSLFFVDNEFLNSNGTSEVRDILEKNEFTYPKPVSLIKKIAKLIPNKNAIILDFFAGSGTTGHAVLELNKEDGGNRQFILCTNNENNICEDVTYERLKRVINGYTTPKGKEVEGLGGNLKYFKTDFIEKDQDEEDLKNQFIDKSLELLSIKEDTYEKLIDNDSFKMNGGVDKVIGLYMDIDTNYKLLDDIQGMFDEYNVGVKKLFMPDQIDIDNDSKIEDLRNSGIEIHRVPRKIIDILEGWRK